MPVYLLHGFRWPRAAIRIHIILQNLDDAAAEWLVAPNTTETLLSNFNEIYPECTEHLHNLRFVEQYDPNDTSSGSQPYAYVADVCEEIKLGIDVDEVRGKGLGNNQWAAMMELRDKLAPNEKVAWYVVVCGDEERWVPGQSASSDSIPHEGSTGASQEGSDSDASYAHSSMGGDDAAPEIRPSSQEEQRQQQQQQPKGLKRFFSTISKRKTSRSNLDSSRSMDSVNTAVQEDIDPRKYATPTPPASDQKAIIPDLQADRTTAHKTSMPKLQTQNLNQKPSNRVLATAPMVQSPGALSLIPDVDEDHEVITGPMQDEDDLAAPAPTVKHGKQQDLVSRQRKRSSMASFTSAVRGTSPETLRNISPLVRSHPDSFSAPFSPIDHHPHALQHELLADEIEDTPPSQPKSISPPASYIPTGAPASGVASIRTSRSTSPVKIAARQRSSSRMSALNALEGNSPVSQSPPKRSVRGGRSRRSSVQSGVTPRHSQYSMSSMSNAMAQLYTTHEREFKNRQSVTQEDLVAKGLDNMDFTALR